MQGEDIVCASSDRRIRDERTEMHGPLVYPLFLQEHGGVARSSSDKR